MFYLNRNGAHDPEDHVCVRGRTHELRLGSGSLFDYTLRNVFEAPGAMYTKVPELKFSNSELVCVI